VKIGVVLNGISLAKDVFYRKYLPAMLREHQVDVFETRSMNDAVSISAKLTGKRYNVIMAAGGDGTVNQVVNGMLSEELANPVLPSLCVLPLGSGNDFARALNQKASVESLLKRLAGGKMKEIDVGEITFCSSPRGEAAQSLRYFVNVADVGMGPPVVRGVLDSGRAFGSAIAYYQRV
jgi:diacylglycerol kinase family enzyme